MKKVIFILTIFLSTLFAQVPQKYENFSLQDVNGKTHSLADFKNSKAIVIIFISTDCPVSNDYNSRMEKLHQEYRGRGVTFIGINSNKEETVEEIKEHAKKNNLTFLILKDFGNKIADKFKASYTPEVYVLNSNFELLYHGRIDDSRKIKNVTKEDLKNALEEILAGKEVTVKETKAFGCTIKRVKND
ncbi:MAG: thioredoxin family protein [Ignavibacteria bacterium]|nr:thioredoxin family protein [Ignavibacteria bacterium]